MAHLLAAAQKALFLDQNPQEALGSMADVWAQYEAGQLKDIAEVRFLVTLAATAHQALGHLEEASRLFATIGDDYNAGYTCLLAGNLEGAKTAWIRLSQKRQNHWCVSLFGLATGQPNSIPTFLQIRNHLEADIQLLAQANQVQMVRNILFALEFLAGINYESYKFAGRALFHAGWLEDVEPILLKGQKILPADPEVYYHLGQYYQAVGRTAEARSALKQCLMISGTYTPAQKILSELEEAVA